MRRCNPQAGETLAAIGPQGRFLLAQGVRYISGFKKRQRVLVVNDPFGDKRLWLYAGRRDYADHVASMLVGMAPRDKSNHELYLWDGVVSVRIDERLRITIPKMMLEQAGIGKQVRIVAMLGRISLAGPHEHEKQMAAFKNTLSPRDRG